MKSKIISLMMVLMLAASGYAFDMEDLNFSGQYRLRWQMMNNLEGEDDAGDFYEFMRNRIHLGMDGNVTDDIYVNIVAEFENTMGDTGWRPATNGRSFKLQTGYAKISDFLVDDMALTVGRQNIFLGRGFVLTSDWAGLDGVKASYAYDDLSLEAFNYRLADADWVRKDEHSKGHMSGLTAFYSLPETDLTGYYIVDYTDDFGQEDSDERNFAGLIADGGFQNFRHYLEYSMQMGNDHNENDYDASLLYAALNYDVPDFHGLSLKADYFLATGDDPETDDNEGFGSSVTYGYFVDTFWYDYYLDAFGSAVTFADISNLESIGAGFSINPREDLNLMAHYYMLAEEVSGDDIGDEVGLKLAYTINDASSVFVTYSRFMPDSEFADEGSDFAALEYAINF